MFDSGVFPALYERRLQLQNRSTELIAFPSDENRATATGNYGRFVGVDLMFMQCVKRGLVCYVDMQIHTDCKRISKINCPDFTTFSIHYQWL